MVLKRILLILSLLAIPLFAFPQASITYWRRVSGSLRPNTSTDSIGASGARISKIWLNDLDSTAGTIGTLSISASASSNITIKKADPSLILDVTTATDTDFWLGVQDDAGSDDDDKFQIGDGETPGTNTFLTIDTSGNVGIGTTGPLDNLHVYGITAGAEDILATLENDATNAGSTATLKFITYDRSAKIQVIRTGQNEGVDIAFLVDGTSAGDSLIEIIRIAESGNVGIGTTSPDRLFHAEAASALTNTIQQVARLSHITSGTPANSIGLGLEFEQETTTDNNEVIATIESVVTDVTAASEDADLVFKTMSAGAAAAERFRINAINGSVDFSVYIHRKVTATITASTTQTQGQGALTSEVNEVSVVANANDTVTLPTAIAGRRVVIINNGANTLRIFPASGDNLGAGVDTATTLASGNNVVYQAYDTTNWESI